MTRLGIYFLFYEFLLWRQIKISPTENVWDVNVDFWDKKVHNLYWQLNWVDIKCFAAEV